MSNGYSNLGYNISGYVEGDLFVPIIPAGGTVSIARSFVLDGLDISEYVHKFEIIRENGKPYTTLSFELSGYQIPDASIRNPLIRLVVTLGTDSFSFIIFDVDRDYDTSQQVIGRTQGCLLDFPFTPVSNGAVLGTANEVLEFLTSALDVYIGLPDFTFYKGDFLLSGSYLNSIDKIVNVSGGTYYEKFNKLFFEKHFRIDSTTTPHIVIGDDILTSKEFSDNFDGSSLVQKVTFNPSANDITSYNLITMVTPDDGGCERPYFMFNPEPESTSDIESNLGTISFTLRQVIHTDTISDNRLVRVDGAIRSIDSIAIDGVETTAYVFDVGHNVILFDEGVSGAVKVVYTTKTVTHYENNGYYNSTDQTYFYSVLYKNQLLQQSIAQCADATGNLDSCTVIVSDDIKRDLPITIDVVNGTLNNMVFVSDPVAPLEDVVGAPAYVKKAGGFDDSFLTGVTETLDYPITLSIRRTVENVTAELAFNDGFEYYGFVTPLGVNETEIMVGSRLIYFSWVEEGRPYRIYYTRDSSILNGTATLTYNTTSTHYEIPPCGADNEVDTIDLYVCDRLQIVSYTDPDATEVCLLPATIEIDVPELLDVDPTRASGRLITLTSVDPVEEILLPTSGVFEYTFTAQTVYVFDTFNVRRGSNITVDTTNAEMA